MNDLRDEENRIVNRVRPLGTTALGTPGISLEPESHVISKIPRAP